MPITTLERAFTLALIALLAFVLLFLFGGTAGSTEAPCSHWASAQGTGSTCTQQAPCRVASWWPLASPGKVLCLADGMYRGEDSMITPPAGMRGTAAKPITIRAEHDGQVLLDAQFSGSAVWLGWHDGRSNDWFVVEGINAKNGEEAVYTVSGADNVLRRVIGWGGKSGGNPYVFNVTGARSRAEDCAGWGLNIRKVFNGSQSGDVGGAGFRRCWGEWNDHPEGSSNPNNTYQIGYGTTNQLFENVIGTQDTKGQVGSSEAVVTAFCGGCQPQAGNSMGGTRLLGSILYIAPGANYTPATLFHAYELSGMAVRDLAMVIPPEYPNKVPFFLLGCQGDTCRENVCTNCLAVSSGVPGVNQAGSGWTMPGLHQGRGLAQATGNRSAFELLPGICREYVNGALTETPLWPWRMSQRIKEARLASGFPAVDVDETIASLLGPIPQQCMRGSTPPGPEPPLPPASATPLACVGIMGEGQQVAIACQPQPGARR